jgi:hypothetical protein
MNLMPRLDQTWHQLLSNRPRGRHRIPTRASTSSLCVRETTPPPPLVGSLFYNGDFGLTPSLSLGAFFDMPSVSIENGTSGRRYDRGLARMQSSLSVYLFEHDIQTLYPEASPGQDHMFQQ